MKTTPHDAQSAVETTEHRPDSATIIHTVITCRNGRPALLDREARQREEAEREELSLTLRSLHQIGIEQTPAPLRRLVREAEIERAVAVLRRFVLLHPGVSMEQVVEHCERAANVELDYFAHVADPLQVRHLLTYHEDIPHEELTAVDLYALDRILENGPETAITGWFGRLDPRHRALPRSTPGYLRSLVARACRDGISAARLGPLAFEVAVLSRRMQGELGWEDSRLFLSLVKQIGGDTVPGLESYLESGEASHAAAQHRAAGHTRQGAYFRQLASYFDHTALPVLERSIQAAVEQRTELVRPMASLPAPAPIACAAVPHPEPRRGLFASLFSLGLSLTARG